MKPNIPQPKHWTRQAGRPIFGYKIGDRIVIYDSMWKFISLIAFIAGMATGILLVK